MRHTGPVNRAQRHVVVIAVGLALAVCASATNRLVSGTGDGGWFMYAPDSGQPFLPSGDATVVRQSLVWLGAVVCWAIVAWRIHRDHPER